MKYLKYVAILFIVVSILLVNAVDILASSKTITIETSQQSDNCRVAYNGSSWDFATQDVITAGYYSDSYYEMYSGMRFQNVKVPQGVSVSEAYISFVACGDSMNDGTEVNTVFYGEDNVEPDAFTSYDDISDRDKTSEEVEWNDIEEWEDGETYESPDLSGIIEEIIENDDWESGYDLVILWGDFEDNSDSGACRRAYSYALGQEYAPILTIKYESSSSSSSSSSSTTYSDLSDQIDTLSSKIDVLQSDIALTDYKTELSSIQQEIIGLKNNLNNTDTDDVSETITEIQKDMISLEKSISNVYSNVTAVYDKQSELEAKLDSLPKSNTSQMLLIIGIAITCLNVVLYFILSKVSKKVDALFEDEENIEE